MKKVAIVIVIATSCDKSAERAEDHLRAMGYKAVACEHEESGVSVCSADNERFRCVSTGATSCEHGPTACERFYTEKPAP